MQFYVSIYQLLGVINRKRKRIPKHAFEKFWALASILLKFGGLVSHVIFSKTVHDEIANNFRTINFVLLLSEHIKRTLALLLLTSLV